MVSIKLLLAAGSAALAAAAPPPFAGPGGPNKTYGCGEVNVFYTYAPSYSQMLPMA